MDIRLYSVIQIKMPRYAQPNLTAGVDQALITTAESVPTFPIMMLLFIYIMIFMGGSSNQKRKTGSADYPMWAVMSGMAVTFMSLLLSISVGIIDIKVLSVVIAVTILSAIWFFLSKQRGEL